MNIIKSLSRLANLLASVYSIETILNLRKRAIESKLPPKENFMNLKGLAMFLLVAVTSLGATTKAQETPQVVFIAGETLTTPEAANSKEKNHELPS
jgi:hypothetical protein